jgi:hypothetical protein
MAPEYTNSPVLVLGGKLDQVRRVAAEYIPRKSFRSNAHAHIATGLTRLIHLTMSLLGILRMCFYPILVALVLIHTRRVWPFHQLTDGERAATKVGMNVHPTLRALRPLT